MAMVASDFVSMVISDFGTIACVYGDFKLFDHDVLDFDILIYAV